MNTEIVTEEFHLHDSYLEIRLPNYERQFYPFSAIRRIKIITKNTG